MRTRFIFNSSKSIFGSNLFSINPQNLKCMLKSSNITASINSSLRKIKQNNLLISDQINNIGFIDLKSALSNQNVNEESLELLKENEVLDDLIEVFFLINN